MQTLAKRLKSRLNRAASKLQQTWQQRDNNGEEGRLPEHPQPKPPLQQLEPRDEHKMSPTPQDNGRQNHHIHPPQIESEITSNFYTAPSSSSIAPSSSSFDQTIPEVDLDVDIDLIDYPAVDPADPIKHTTPRDTPSSPIKATTPLMTPNSPAKITIPHSPPSQSPTLPGKDQGVINLENLVIMDSSVGNAAAGQEEPAHEEHGNQNYDTHQSRIGPSGSLFDEGLLNFDLDVNIFPTTTEDSAPNATIPYITSSRSPPRDDGNQSITVVTDLPVVDTLVSHGIEEQQDSQAIHGNNIQNYYSLESQMVSISPSATSASLFDESLLDFDLDGDIGMMDFTTVNEDTANMVGNSVTNPMKSAIPHITPSLSPTPRDSDQVMMNFEDIDVAEPIITDGIGTLTPTATEPSPTISSVKPQPYVPVKKPKSLVTAKPKLRPIQPKPILPAPTPFVNAMASLKPACATQSSLKRSSSKETESKRSAKKQTPIPESESAPMPYYLPYGYPDPSARSGSSTMYPPYFHQAHYLRGSLYHPYPHPSAYSYSPPSCSHPPPHSHPHAFSYSGHPAPPLPQSQPQPQPPSSMSSHPSYPSQYPSQFPQLKHPRPIMAGTTTPPYIAQHYIYEHGPQRQQYPTHPVPNPTSNPPPGTSYPRSSAPPQPGYGYPMARPEMSMPTSSMIGDVSKSSSGINEGVPAHIASASMSSPGPIMAGYGPVHHQRPPPVHSLQQSHATGLPPNHPMASTYWHPGMKEGPPSAKVDPFMGRMSY
ncbi:hypothetical protein HDU76_012083 [Blyttiomyces sp. JEL0837]|nr:hypothetical protein HDU76_012083 [Blyttiomyces sp. JEL0837]